MKDNWLETLYIKMKKEEVKSEIVDSEVEIEEIVPEPKDEKTDQDEKTGRPGLSTRGVLP